MLTDGEKTVIRDTWRLVVPLGETVADLFYKRLFELQPEYQRLFPPDMSRQKRKLLAMLAFTVKSLDYPDSAWRDIVGEENDLFLILLALGRRHTDLYHIPDESYETVGAALMWTLDYGLGKKFTPAARDAWTRVYRLLSMTMKMGRLSVPERAAVTSGINNILGPDAKRGQGRPQEGRTT